MRIVMNKPLEDCFAESLTQEVGLDDAITERFIHHLGQAGDLQYFPTFSRPYFKLDVRSRYTITGIQGNSSLRVVLCHDNQADSIRHLARLVESFGVGE